MKTFYVPTLNFFWKLGKDLPSLVAELRLAKESGDSLVWETTGKALV